MSDWRLVQTIRRDELPGLALVAVAVIGALRLSTVVDVSPLVAGVLLGVVASNIGIVKETYRAGVAFAARRILRVGIVLLGLRLSVDEVRALGVTGLVGVLVVLLMTFFGVQLLARALGLTRGLGLLLATGSAICGASAIAAMAPLAEADEEETAYAIGLVTLFGTLSIFVLPLVGRSLGLADRTFGTWAGAGVHDVGQVTATASSYAAAALAPAMLVKLTRVALLAPLLFGVGVVRRRRGAIATVDVADTTEQGHLRAGQSTAPLLPLFVVGFLAAIALRATGWLSTDTLSVAQEFEEVFLTAGMFGLGTGVQIARLWRLGGRPLILGVASWALVAGGALIMAVVVQP